MSFCMLVWPYNMCIRSGESPSITTVGMPRSLSKISSSRTAVAFASMLYGSRQPLKLTVLVATTLTPSSDITSPNLNTLVVLWSPPLKLMFEATPHLRWLSSMTLQHCRISHVCIPWSFSFWLANISWWSPSTAILTATAGSVRVPPKWAYCTPLMPDNGSYH